MGKNDGTTPRLILHIGSQKTGTTSIQDFLKNNADLLADAGVNFVQAGRTNISHNMMLQVFRRGKGNKVVRRIIGEMDYMPDMTHVISSEMFFRRGVGSVFERKFPEDLRARTKVVVYLRRQDRFLEAMYKQRVKNGRFTGTPEAYRKRRGPILYSPIIAEFERAFGQENLVVQPFERAEFPQGNVVLDFARHIGLHDLGPDDFESGSANATLSREVTALLGVVSKTSSFNTREIIRDIIRHRPKGAIRSQDCYNLGTCRQIMAEVEADNEMIRQVYCPDRTSLFDMKGLEPAAVLDIPSPEERRLRMEQANQAVFEAIGRLQEQEREQQAAAAVAAKG